MPPRRGGRGGRGRGRGGGRGGGRAGAARADHGGFAAAAAAGAGAGARAPRLGPDQWQCSTCLFPNHVLMEYCEQCSSGRRDAPLDAAAFDAAAAGAASVKGSTGGVTAATTDEEDPDDPAPPRLRLLLTSTSTSVGTMAHHYAAIRDGAGGVDAYVRCLTTLTSRGVVVPSVQRARALAALWCAGARNHFDALLADPSFDVGIVEVVRMCTILDAPRQLRAVERRLATLTARAAEHPGRVHRGTLGRLTAQANELRVHVLPKDPPGSRFDHAGGGTAAAAGASGSSTTTAAASGGGASVSAGAGAAKAPTSPFQSMTSSLIRRIKAWAGSLSAERLEFIALTLPLDPWRTLADLAHLKPTDLAVPYFIPMAFGTDPPAESLVARVRAAGPEDIAALLREFPRLAQMYSYLRTRFTPVETTLPDVAKTELARVGSLEDLLWFYEELRCGPVDTLLTERLGRGEEIASDRGRSAFGKLMERMLAFADLGAPFAKLLMPYAEERLAAVKRAAARGGVGLDGAEAPEGESGSGGADSGVPAAPAEVVRTGSGGGGRVGAYRVAVCGDASGSMEVAIRSATILGGLLSAVLDADLSFFNTSVVQPSVQPRTAEQVLAVTREILAEGQTAPAAALAHYIATGAQYDMIICVTDEAENSMAGGHDFAQLFRQYREKVYAGANLFFVSFLPATIKQGLMVTKLLRSGVRARFFKFDPTRPDLTKFDSLVGMLMVETGLAAVGEGGGGGGGASAPRVTATGGGAAAADDGDEAKGDEAAAATLPAAADATALAAEVERLKAELAAARAAAAAGASAAAAAASVAPAGSGESAGPEDAQPAEQDQDI